MRRATRERWLEGLLWVLAALLLEAAVAIAVAVLAAGDGGPARLDAQDLASIIRSLRALGLSDDARRFAVEALLAGQPG